LLEKVTDLRATILQYLKEHNVATLATYGQGGPWAAAVFYVNDEDFSLYFLSNPETRHGRDLAANPQVAAAIHEDYRDWRRIKGVQLEGQAGLVTSPLELAKAWSLYLAKFPFVKGFLRAPGEFLEEYAPRMGHVRFYRLVTIRLWFTDNEQGFGHREQLLLR